MVVFNNGVVLSWLAYYDSNSSATKITLTYPYTYKTKCRIAESHINTTNSTDQVSIRYTCIYSYNLSTTIRWMFGGTYMYIIIGY